MIESDEREQAIVEFLESLSPPIAHLCERLRVLVKKAVPESIERLRPGWRLIGYDLPASGKGSDKFKGVYFAWVGPEVEHVHVGWQMGTLMNDPSTASWRPPQAQEGPLPDLSVGGLFALVSSKLYARCGTHRGACHTANASFWRSAAQAASTADNRSLMRIATWNVNSLKARLERVEWWLDARARRPAHAGDQARATPTRR